MKSQVWLTIFGVVSLLVLGAAGFFCFSASQAYSTSRSTWDQKVGTIRALESKPLYPDQDNVDKAQGIVTEYNQAVEELFAGLDKFQKPLNLALSNVEFVDLVKNKVTEFRSHARAQNFELEAGEDFQLGFDVYADSVPAPQLVPILDYELNAIDHLLRRLIAAGASSMNSFSRDLIPGEVGGPEAQESGVVHKYPVRIGFRASHAAFREFLNGLSNDREFFYVIRVLKLTNDEMEGPLKETGEFVSAFPRFEDPDTKVVADIERLESWGWTPEGGSPPDLEEKARADGFVPSGRDARVIFGQEDLNVFMLVDIIRFLDPSEVEEAPESDSRRRRTGRDR